MINIFVLSSLLGVAKKEGALLRCRLVTLRGAPGFVVSGFIVGYWGDDGMEFLVQLPEKIKTSLGEWALKIDEAGGPHSGFDFIEPKDFIEIDSQSRDAYIFASNKEEAVKAAYEAGLRAHPTEWHDLAHYEYLQNRKPEDIRGE